MRDQHLLFFLLNFCSRVVLKYWTICVSLKKNKDLQNIIISKLEKVDALCSYHWTLVQPYYIFSISEINILLYRGYIQVCLNTFHLYISKILIYEKRIFVIYKYFF